MFHHSINNVFWLHEEIFRVNLFLLLPRPCYCAMVDVVLSLVLLFTVGLFRVGDCESEQKYLWTWTCNMTKFWIIICNKMCVCESLRCRFFCYTVLMWNHTQVSKSKIVFFICFFCQFLLWEKWDHKDTGNILFLHDFIKNEHKQKTCTHIHTRTHTKQYPSTNRFLPINNSWNNVTFTHWNQSLPTYRNQKQAC